MRDVEVIEEAPAAAAALDPLRASMLAALATPASAAMLATDLGVPRQKINYHLHELERHGLVTLVEERRKRNMTERLFQASAASYVISPVALAEVAPDPGRHTDRLSARWLIALASRVVQELGRMLGDASRAGKRVATFALDGEIRFASAADRAAFAQELTDAVTRLVAKYHDAATPGARTYRILVGVHPRGGTRRGKGDTSATEEA